MSDGQIVVGMAPSRKYARYILLRCACGVERPVNEGRYVNEGRPKCCRGCSAKNQTGPKGGAWRGGRHIPLTHYHKFKRSAARRSIPWKLTINDLDELYDRQRGLCALSETQLQFDHGQNNGVERGNASLDRKNSKLGYVTSNVQFVTKTINIAKQSLGNAEFAEICIAVVNRLL